MSEELTVNKAAAALLLLLVATATPVFAQSKTGTSVAQFIGIEPSARIAAIGNAGVALYDGIQAVYYNPAALGALERTTLQFTHGFWFAGIRYDYAAAAVSLGAGGTVFASVTSLNSGDIAVRTVEQPLGTGERYTVQDVAIGIGYGRNMTRRFGAGVQVNYVSETIWLASMQTLTFSIGTNYRLSNSGITLGASLSNFGTKGRFEGQALSIQFDNDPERHGDNSALPAEQFTGEFPVPILFRVGMSFPHHFSNRTKLLFNVDAFHPSDNTESMSVGWEVSWNDALALRVGYQNLFLEDSDVGPTAGVGIQAGIGARRFHFDYAWTSHLFLQDTHRLTFAMTL
jgi:hypothetical protein